ncbi:H-NS histone family protein [Lysobacter capsici]|nr:H-NS histone family protein [Lysobacter capsici]WND80374.1 H-NS histone family protein [Lysobacter capsici]WND85571.1 H-NS histone family protein [Lysobacter capsici]
MFHLYRFSANASPRRDWARRIHNRRALRRSVSGRGCSAAKKWTPHRKSRKVAAKYRGPENPRNTWSGRRRMPRWLAKKTKYGRSVTDFLIPGLAKPTARKTSSIGKKRVIKQG